MKIKELQDVFNACLEDGIIRKKDHIDIELIKSLLDSAVKELECAKEIDKKVKYHFILFNNRYDILRKLISAFILFDKIKIENHQCINAYLCSRHPGLEIDWKILETIRIIRNKINYEGKKIDKSSWNLHKLQFDIYIVLFVNEVKKKIAEQKL